MKYRITNGSVGIPGYTMAYKQYKPENSSGAVLVFLPGGGHTMKVWEITPDGRPGWAPLFAETGREVILIDWGRELSTITQRENMKLIEMVIATALEDTNRKIIFFAWSMGGPQSFVLATDHMPKRTVAILGYGATGPLNFYDPPSDIVWNPVDKIEQGILSQEKISRICDSPLFPKEYMQKYIEEYLIPLPPRAVALQAKHPDLKDLWETLMVKNPDALPPVFIVSGTRDERRSPENIASFKNWLSLYQKDASFVYVDDFPHLGMLCRGNETILPLYMEWLAAHHL